MDRALKYVFIINPIAGPRNNLKFWEKLETYLAEKDINLKVKFTKRSGHATHLAEKRLAKKKEAIIVSLGGDGTFNEVASALVNSTAKLAHIPRGSGNGLARMLKIPHSAKKIADYLVRGKAHKIDAGKVNDRYFFCTAGFGFDALIAHHFSTSSSRGLKSYVFYTLKSFFRYKGVEADFELDGERYSGRFFTVTIANANQFGNNAFIAPKAEVNDGWLDVTMIRMFPRILTPFVALALFGKWIHKFSFVETRRVKHIKINSVSSPYFHRDGDAEECTLPAEISVIPSALNLIVPEE